MTIRPLSYWYDLWKNRIEIRCALCGKHIRGPKRGVGDPRREYSDICNDCYRSEMKLLAT